MADAVAQAAPAADAQNANAQAPQGQSYFGVVKGLLMRAVFIYMITSFFRRPQAPVTGDGKAAPGIVHAPSSNLFPNGTTFDLYLYICEDKLLPNFNDPKQLVWFKDDLVYGDWKSGPDGDGIFTTETTFQLSERVQNNGSLWLHVYVVRTRDSPDPASKEHNPIYTIHRVKQLNKYKKRSYKKTHNLLTGETTATEAEKEKIQQNIKQEVLSHWHPNLTINIVDDHTAWSKGQVPSPLQDFIEFEPTTGQYYPIVYLNDYWNLMRDYMPINDTVKEITLRFTYQPLSMFKWQLYTAQAMRNKWSSFMGSDLLNQEVDDDEQDVIKETFLETNPILLGLTVIVSITHSIFEFLAFKNDIQFWKERRSLEGLSVRSVFFNVFQSFIVLLYVWDNDTNIMIRISVFIGLLIELWKIKKVINIELVRDQKLFGILPMIRFSDKGSYVESSTRQYDQLAFKYLSWLLFPLFLGYGVYSLMYNEHKSWYSFFLNMIYGFLLTFGFIMMTPQLFINYKLKSVAHLPWRMLTYKFLNTFIDDIFAFVIKMPTMYRIGCFRDDIIFLIFLYQRWIYRVDHSRVNEFGISGDDIAEAERAKKEGTAPVADAEQRQALQNGEESTSDSSAAAAAPVEESKKTK